MGSLASDLERQGLVSLDAGSIALTQSGDEALEKLVEAGCAELTALVDGRRDHAEDLAPVLRRLAASLVAAIPEKTA